ncbi:ATP-binding protein, partial [Clostridium sardiniense]|uniref:ATP-binding protein n=1 Tax=Clostridium sardiniense TaxID=29369 RepID=UPI003D352452
LSYCIAKELLDMGFLVVYKTADELINCLRDIKFNNNYYLGKLLIDCDLLIIDDLGSEQLNDFVATELFNLINKKLLKKKRMLVSTNFPLSYIAKHYSERISSRLLGNFRLYKFYSDDIRIKLNLAKR